MFYKFAWHLLYLFVKILYRLEVKGRENFPQQGPVIAVANHANLMDPILMGIGLGRRQVCFMAKEQLFKIPVLGWIIRRLGVFPVKRGASDREAIRFALRILGEGKVLGMFPEGTRYRDGSIHALRSGAATLAVKSGAVVLPIFIQNSHHIKFLRFPKIRMLIGEPFKIKLLDNKRETITEGTRLLQEKMRALSEQLKQSMTDEE